MRLRIGLVGLASLSVTSAYADADVTPPAIYASQLWQGKTQAVLHVLNRVDGKVETVTVPVGEKTAFHTLSLSVEACLTRPPAVPADSAAMLHLLDNSDTTRPPFDGWMLSNEPGLSVYGNPLYDVRVVECRGRNIPPNPGGPPVQQQAPLTFQGASAPQERPTPQGLSQGLSAPQELSPPHGASAPQTLPRHDSTTPIQPSSPSEGQAADERPAVPLAPENHASIPLAPPSTAPLPPSDTSPPLDLGPPQSDPGLE